MTRSVSRKAYDSYLTVLKSGAVGKIENGWLKDGILYTVSIGTEHINGALTGMVMKQHTGVKVSKKSVRKRAGFFRIEADGLIKRWPHANKKMLETIHKINGKDFIVI